MNKYIVYFENERGDVLLQEVKASCLREAVLFAMKDIRCEGKDYIPIKCNLGTIDTVNYNEIRSDYVEKAS